MWKPCSKNQLGMFINGKECGVAQSKQTLRLIWKQTLKRVARKEITVSWARMYYRTFKDFVKTTDFFLITKASCWKFWKVEYLLPLAVKVRKKYGGNEVRDQRRWASVNVGDTLGSSCSSARERWWWLGLGWHN